MKTFNCSCVGNPLLFFESNTCTSCGRTVGIDDGFSQVEVYNLNPTTGMYYQEDDQTTAYKKCQNFESYQICNGMIPQNKNDFDDQYCFSCRFNKIIPDLSIPEHIVLWKRMETAKRRALYTLKKLGLPLNNFNQNPDLGISFTFATDRNVSDHFDSRLFRHPEVTTGHNQGEITINLAEADDVARSKTRIEMKERYRTLLGHFRHELGHYYFDILIGGIPENENMFTTVFGDFRQDYQQAMDNYYRNGAPDNWRYHFISAYATMHPWEDWAESWAHYMHIADTMETAQSYRLTEFSLFDIIQNTQAYTGPSSSIDHILDSWIELSVMLNSLNRSMGLQDAYPFILNDQVRKKLKYIHEIISGYTE